MEIQFVGIVPSRPAKASSAGLGDIGKKVPSFVASENESAGCLHNQQYWWLKTSFYKFRSEVSDNGLT